MAAAMIGSAAFFAPLQRTSPCNGTPPVIWKWDMGEGSAAIALSALSTVIPAIFVKGRKTTLNSDV